MLSVCEGANTRPQMPLSVIQVIETIDDTPSTWMFVFTAISATLVPLTGFLDSLIYGWDRKVWDAVVACLLWRRQGPRAGLPSGTNQQSTNRQPLADDQEGRYGVGQELTEETFAFSDSD